jgi:hypothetical protein
VTPLIADLAQQFEEFLLARLRPGEDFIHIVGVYRVG